MHHCFTYGSLMCEDIMAAVAGRRFRREPAELHGYGRHPVRGEAYPGIVAAPHGKVGGVLYLDVDRAAFNRLDAFEGEQYERRTVHVRLDHGAVVDAETYIFRTAFRHLLLPGEWDFDAFLKSGKQHFETLYVGYERVGFHTDGEVGD